MKKLLYTFVAAILLVGCVGTPSKTNQGDSCCDQETKATTKSYRLEALLEDADKLVDQEVTVVGSITHTCKHSGRRCFMIADDQKTTLRIEAKGDLGGFSRELIGAELAATGILRENRLTNEYLNSWEEEVREKEGSDDGSVESCDAEINNINDMRAWMKKNNKEYYSLYYMDCTSFEVVE